MDESDVDMLHELDPLRGFEGRATSPLCPWCLLREAFEGLDHFACLLRHDISRVCWAKDEFSGKLASVQ